MAQFLLIFALSLFLKEQKNDHSFEKSDKKSGRSFPLFKRVTKEKLLFCSFAKSDKKSDCSFTLF